MNHDNLSRDEAAALRLHEAYVSKVNDAQEHGNDQRAIELANDYLAQLRGLSPALTPSGPPLAG
jgi:hypothetical protein